MKRKRASLTRMAKWNHHQAFPSGLNPGGARKPPSSLDKLPFVPGTPSRNTFRSDMIISRECPEAWSREALVAPGEGLADRGERALNLTSVAWKR